VRVAPGRIKNLLPLQQQEHNEMAETKKSYIQNVAHEKMNYTRCRIIIRMKSGIEAKKSISPRLLKNRLENPVKWRFCCCKKGSWMAISTLTLCLSPLSPHYPCKNQGVERQ